MERLHIVGLGPRTGTTLLAECMVACFEIDAFEPHEASLRLHRAGAEIYLTKNPTDLNIVGPRLRIDPHLHVIVMVRDPRDVIVSRHARNKDRYWVPLRYWKRHFHLMRRLEHHFRLLTVRYECLVEDPDAVQEALSSSLPFLKRKAHFSDFHRRARPSVKSLRAMGPLRPFDRSSIGNWRAHLPRVAGQIAAHGGIASELIALGYEKDDSWLDALVDVVPDRSPSHLPETLKIPVWDIRRRAFAEAVTIGVARLWGRPLA